MSHWLFDSIRRKVSDPGDIVEFGTNCGNTAIALAQTFPDRRIFTIEHFKGLEATRKHMPVTHRGEPIWPEGEFQCDRALTQAALAPFSNITLIDCDIHQLRSPAYYGIGRVAMAHIDVDIYEPTVASLQFLTECLWSTLCIQFDDWHGGEPQFDEHERLACQEWVEANGYQLDKLCDGLRGEVQVRR